jgi:HK97 family phage prohead protease
MMGNKEIRFFEFELEMDTRAGDSASTIRGYALKWNSLSEDLGGFKEQFIQGAFANSLRKNPVFAFWSHDTAKILGSTRNGSLEIKEDDLGLNFKVTLPDTQNGKDALTLIRNKFITGMSFGFTPSVEEWNESDPKMLIRTVKEARLFEVSPVAMPAYSQSYVSARENQNVMSDYLKTQQARILRGHKIREEILKNKGVI